MVGPADLPRSEPDEVVTFRVAAFRSGRNCGYSPRERPWLEALGGPGIRQQGPYAAEYPADGSLPSLCAQ